MKIKSYTTHVLNYSCSIIKTKREQNNYNNLNDNIRDHKITKQNDPHTIVISCYRVSNLNK